MEQHLPPEPEEPAPWDCCHNDCSPCVKDLYVQALQRHRTAVRLLQAQKAAGAAPPCSIALVPVDVSSPASSVRSSPAASIASVGSSTTALLWAPIVSATVMTETGLAAGLDVRRVVLAELQLPRQMHGSYAPGDYAVVRPHNNLSDVLALLRRLRVQGDQAYSVVSTSDDSEEENVVDYNGNADDTFASRHHHLIGEPPCSIRDILMYKCDISSPPSKALLHSLAQFTFDEEEKEELQYLCGQEKWQREFYHRNIMMQRPNLLEILERYPSCVPPLVYVLEHLPPQRERYYSIASSPLFYPSSIHLLFPVVEYITPAPQRRRRYGLCTSWLHALAFSSCDSSIVAQDRGDNEDRELKHIGDRGVELRLKRTIDFKLPDDPRVPLIFICAGSGIAPFRGFLQHRWALKKQFQTTLGESWLFYGFRFQNGDFLFRDELDRMLNEEVLTRLITAASREGEKKPRVQDKVIEFGQDIYRLLQQRAVLFVCGDARGMAAEVHSALVRVIQTYDTTCQDPQAAVAQLKQEGRYLRDVWSAPQSVI